MLILGMDFPNHIKGNIDEANVIFMFGKSYWWSKNQCVDGSYILWKSKRIRSGDESLNILDDRGKLKRSANEYIKEHIVDVRETSSILYNELKL